MISNKNGLIYAKKTIAVFQQLDDFIRLYESRKGGKPSALAISPQQASCLPRDILTKGYKGISVMVAK